MDTITKIRRKFNIKGVGALLIVFLLILLFLSKTIYYYNLPKVTAASPLSGNLSHYETTSGIVQWANTEDIYSEVEGTIEEIFVEEGERITKGQPLFHLQNDKAEIVNRLKEIEINKKKLQVELEEIEMQINDAKNVISHPTAANDLVKIDIQISKLESQRNSAEDEYNKYKILYEEGAISKQELDNKKTILQNLEYDWQSLKNEYEKVYKAYQDDLSALNQGLASKKLDFTNLLNQEDIYKKELSDYENNTVVTAPRDATVILIPVKKGQYINSNQRMMSFGVGNDFEIIGEIPLDNNFIAIDDTCQLTNSSHAFEGVVTQITATENSKQVKAIFTSDEVTLGETFEIEFSKESTTSYTIVPNGAINKDTDGYFIYLIKKRKGMLGDEYYVKKAYVYIGSSDHDNTVITKGIDMFEPIVLLSDQPFSDGEIVKVENVGDFFAE
ncbi:HlyD family secretion protein [Schinkia azotoformans]|uniref:HlyD family secretion protein n=1 Tax=Schinkia azotoformans TaxID=1454 RepID=UPI002DBFE508|nr:hypothetical protein [Schinkia azotoformans]MEC1722556.1 hypothetical protein [Schinkia azotoformans]MED4411553.1 hypothetical protein [Schinkia azotoformans]